MPALLLSGCFATGQTAVKMDFPAVPTELMTACPDLQTIDKDKAEHEAKLQKMADKSAQKNESSGTFGKLKQIL